MNTNYVEIRLMQMQDFDSQTLFVATVWLAAPPDPVATFVCGTGDYYDVRGVLEEVLRLLRRHAFELELP